MNTNADLTILRTLLNAIFNDPNHPMALHLDALKDLEKRFSCGDSDASNRFWQIVKNGEFGDKVLADTVQLACGFVETQIEVLTAIKNQRPFTTEGKQNAKQALEGILKSLKELIATDE